MTQKFTGTAIRKEDWRRARSVDTSDLTVGHDGQDPTSPACSRMRTRTHRRRPTTHPTRRTLPMGHRRWLGSGGPGRGALGHGAGARAYGSLRICASEDVTTSSRARGGFRRWQRLCNSNRAKLLRLLPSRFPEQQAGGVAGWFPTLNYWNLRGEKWAASDSN